MCNICSAQAGGACDGVMDLFRDQYQTLPFRREYRNNGQTVNQTPPRLEAAFVVSMRPYKAGSSGLSRQSFVASSSVPFTMTSGKSPLATAASWNAKIASVSSYPVAPSAIQPGETLSERRHVGET